MLASTLVTVLLVSFLFYLLRNYFSVSPSIPGPFLAHFTDLWRAYKQYNGQLRSELTLLHAQYGSVVRYGIKSVSFSDPKAIETIYESRDGFLIADSYNVLVGISNGKEVPSLVSTRDETRHGQLRRSVASAFTARGAQAYERSVGAVIPDLFESIDRSVTRPIDLSNLFMLYSMDSAARMAFSQSLGCLKAGRDVDGSIELIRNRFRHWGWWSSVPWLERIVYRNPYAIQQSKGRTPGAMVRNAASKMKVRINEQAQETVDMLDYFILAHHTNPKLLDEQGIVSLLMSTISGAGDTTATTMTAIVFFLIKHPLELARLRAELGAAGVPSNTIPSSVTVNKLPYLAAVIKESMRLYASTTWPTERRVPAGGRTIAGHHFPEGTSVGVFIPSVHLTEDFGEDAAEFRPQRWIEADADKLKSMERAFMGFSRGKRVCLGQHVALMQMKKVIPALIMNYDIDFLQADAELEADLSSAVACLKPLLVIIKSRGP